MKTEAVGTDIVFHGDTMTYVAEGYILGQVRDGELYEYDFFPLKKEFIQKMRCHFKHLKAQGLV